MQRRINKLNFRNVAAGFNPQKKTVGTAHSFFYIFIKFSSWQNSQLNKKEVESHLIKTTLENRFPLDQDYKIIRRLALKEKNKDALLALAKFKTLKMFNLLLNLEKAI